jgi:hypothetical protein
LFQGISGRKETFIFGVFEKRIKGILRLIGKIVHAMLKFHW